LSADERGRQLDAVVHLMQSPPATVGALVEQFLGRV
jgi:hypothetical protein